MAIGLDGLRAIAYAGVAAAELSSISELVHELWRVIGQRDMMCTDMMNSVVALLRMRTSALSKELWSLRKLVRHVEVLGPDMLGPDTLRC